MPIVDILIAENINIEKLRKGLQYLGMQFASFENAEDKQAAALLILSMWCWQWILKKSRGQPN